MYETLDWYSDRASRLPNSVFPWLGRGSDFDFNNGAFYFSDNSNRGVFHTILIVDEPTL